MTSNDQIAQHIGYEYHSESADSVKYIWKDIFICIDKKQYSDQKETKWKR